VGPSTVALANLAEKWQASVKANDTKAIAAAYTDRAVPNLSSIALYLRHGERTALLTGDARGDQLLAGLEAAGLMATGGAIHVDVFKLPHHGSENNVDPSLFERVWADHYVVCADGIKHAHPSNTTLEWLVASRARDEVHAVHLTNHIAAAEAILAQLAVGRSFTVAVGTPRVEITLTDDP
jgi:beta-lactamase superfamily II metal-dependent hydrolase